MDCVFQVVDTTIDMDCRLNAEQLHGHVVHGEEYYQEVEMRVVVQEPYSAPEHEQ